MKIKGTCALSIKCTASYCRIVIHILIKLNNLNDKHYPDFWVSPRHFIYLMIRMSNLMLSYVFEYLLYYFKPFGDLNIITERTSSRHGTLFFACR